MSLRQRVVKESGLLLALAIICGVTTWAIHPKAPPWNRPLLNEGAARLENLLPAIESILWVDARSADDYEKEHIPNALLLNEDAWDELLGSFIEQWQPDLKVVVYCSVQQCQSSKQVARRLKEELQIENIFYLEGGWEAWEKSKSSPPQPSF